MCVGAIKGSTDIMHPHACVMAAYVFCLVNVSSSLNRLLFTADNKTAERVLRMSCASEGGDMCTLSYRPSVSNAV